MRELTRARWNYLNEMLRFSLSSWIFGFACFFSTLLVFRPQIVEQGMTYSSSFGLLIFGEAVALLIIALRVRRYDQGLRKLESARRKLLLEYQKLMLSYVKATIRGRLPTL
ncbi:MAG: hypothetical protein QW356_00565 [Candidatus Hadarchaeales archaeon]